MLRKLFVLMMCCLLLTSTGYHCCAQTTTETEYPAPTRNITTQEWNDLTNDRDFSYRDKLENDAAPPKKNDRLARFLQAIIMFLSSTTGQILIWGLLILVVAYAVYKLVIGDRAGLFGRRTQRQKVEEQVITENIHDTNWEKLLESAVADGNLRLAVRYSYMLLLQMLERNELIAYRNDKTNYQYASELADTPYKQPFRQLSRQYEYTWYGNFPMTESSYREYMNTLMALKNKLAK